MSYLPSFSLIANDKDVTEVFKQRLISLSLTDCAGTESDRLSITIELPNTVAAPIKGAVLKLKLGFGDELVEKGQFVVDEVVISGPPRQCVITANAAPMNNEKQLANLQTHKSRVWDDVTLSDVVQTVAKDHDLTAKISADLVSIVIEHIDQVNESDMNLLARLAKQYGAVSKPANGCWLFIKEGKSKSASGALLSEITLTPDKVTTWSCKQSSRGNARKVSATYADAESGKVKSVSIGSGEPELKIVWQYPNETEAKAAITARSKTAKTSNDTLNITLPATPELMPLTAKSQVLLDGFGDAEDRAWGALKLVWGLGSQGLGLSIECDANVA